MTGGSDIEGGPTPATVWRQAGRALLARLIAELAYEELLRPEPLDAEPPPDAHPGAPAAGQEPHRPTGRGPSRPYRLTTAQGGYTFQARRGTFGAWWVEPASIMRSATAAVGTAVGAAVGAAADDPVLFLREVQPLLGWPDGVLADVIGDLLATQAADRRLAESAVPAADLADLSFVELEGRQGGHPCLVANKGRLGFGAQTDLYTPEARSTFRLRWVAAHPAIGIFQQAEGAAPGETDLLATELDDDTRAAFTGALRRALADQTATATATEPGADYVWLPVHPWQWANVIVPLFAAELATGLLVPLGEGPDRYVPLQAVRTVANVDAPLRRNVKLALMIRNTLVWRGMSGADAIAGPAVSRWLMDLRDADPFLHATTGVLPLPEVAGATVRHPTYDAIPQAPYRLHELLGVLWRDPIGRYLAPDEQARSLASLLLVGADGRALATELVARSGYPAQDWLAALLDALLPPLLHYLYRYGVAFTPHGENVLVVFGAAGFPSRIAVKDFGADIELVDGEFPERQPLPAAVAEHCRGWSGEMLAHSVLSALFAGHFRFFATLSEDHLGVPEEVFWQLVRTTIDGYHARFPELVARFALIDLLTPQFDRICLNREQFAGAGFHDRAARDGSFDLIHGTIANPVADPAAPPAGTASPEQAAHRPDPAVLADLLSGDDPVDEVVVATVDLPGRLVGSVVSPEYFAEEVLAAGMGACAYLHAVDVDMQTDPGYPGNPSLDGFGDLRLQPDLTSLRRAPWRRSTAVVLADATWPDGSIVDASPRAVLRRQLDALAGRGLIALAGTELEFLAFRESYEQAARQSWADLAPASRYNIDYALSGAEELDELARRIRQAMAQAGIPVESARGEVHPGQYEIVFRYAEALHACDVHVLYKTTAKRLAAAAGRSLTFMAKYDSGEGNSCHIHLSLREAAGGAAVFAAPVADGPGGRADTAGMSPMMRAFVAGQLACMADFTLLFAPNINSYKRLVPEAFAPTGISWGRDNRTCAVRVVGSGPGLRLEHRVPGGDANPYLAVAAIIAAGRYGMDNGLDLEPGRVGNVFTAQDVAALPATLGEAAQRWRASPVARALFGEQVVAHLAQAAAGELASHGRTVTDWERRRGFERC